MRISAKFKLLVVCLTALGAMSVVGASAASAAPATFNVTASTPALASGSLTLTNGSQTITCNVVNRKLQASNNAGSGILAATQTFSETTTCDNGRIFSLDFISQATNTGTKFLLTNLWVGYSAKSPFAPPAADKYAQAGYAVPFINGSGSTQSKLVFNNTTLGTMPWGGAIKATGTLNVRKADGTPLLLS